MKGTGGRSGNSESGGPHPRQSDVTTTGSRQRKRRDEVERGRRKNARLSAVTRAKVSG